VSADTRHAAASSRLLRPSKETENGTLYREEVTSRDLGEDKPAGADRRELVSPRSERRASGPRRAEPRLDVGRVKRREIGAREDPSRVGAGERAASGERWKRVALST
jgi:hypothetical protein